MVKISQLVLPLFLVGSAAGFAPASPRAFARPVTLLSMSEESEEAPAPAPAPAAPVATGGALVPIKEETVEFTAGLIGGVAGFALGGPVLGAIGAAAANYASKTDQEIGTVISAVSKSSIEIFNYLANLDAKYEVLNKAKTSLEGALEKVKSGDNVDPETVEKVEKALSATKAKITEINDEYDLVGAGSTALGVVGDLVEKAVQKAGELNSEYNLTDKAKASLSTAVEKAKEKASSSL